jgi:hypothetical protein
MRCRDAHILPETQFGSYYNLFIPEEEDKAVDLSVFDAGLRRRLNPDHMILMSVHRKVKRAGHLISTFGSTLTWSVGITHPQVLTC